MTRSKLNTELMLLWLAIILALLVTLLCAAMLVRMHHEQCVYRDEFKELRSTLYGFTHASTNISPLPNPVWTNQYWVVSNITWTTP